VGQCSSARDKRNAGIWDWRPKRVRTLVSAVNGGYVFAIALSADGRTVLVSSSNEIQARDAALQHPVGGSMMQREGRMAVSALAFSPDGSRIAAADGDAVLIWDSRSAYHPDAAALVTRLFDELALVDAVSARLRLDDKLEPELRAAALRIVQGRTDRAWALNGRVREGVRVAGAPIENYRRKIPRAERAVQLEPSSANVVNTLGMANYRAGAWREAVTVLERAASMRPAPSAEGIAFLAMAHHRLGETGAARAALEQVRAAMRKPENTEAGATIGRTNVMARVRSGCWSTR
jgi:hypothetical protein